MENKVKEFTGVETRMWKIRNTINEYKILFWWLTLLTLTPVYSPEINKAYENTKLWVSRTLNDNFWFSLNTTETDVLDQIIQDTIKKVGSDDIHNKQFQEALFKSIKKHDLINGTSILQAFIVFILYLSAYWEQLINQLKFGLPVKSKTFETFCLSNWLMVFINWLVPWSAVYLEWSVLAWTAVWINKFNELTWKKYSKWILQDLPVPIATYNKYWMPTLWNTKLEEESGYLEEEVIAYYKKNWEVMTLLYKWEELERVRQYLSKIEKDWVWYSDVAFTMTTKSWKLKTFLWTTRPNWQGWTNRYAKHLKSKEEIEEELAKTRFLLNEMEEKALSDILTWVSNRRKLEEDLHNLFTRKLRKSDPKDIVVALIDIDDFRQYNTKEGHAAGDKVLKDFSMYMKEERNLRPGDGFYRLGGDEFIIVFENTSTEEIIWKLNKIRQDYFDTTWIWTSWWLKYFNVNEYYKDGQTLEETQQIIEYIKDEADYYMYSVKYFKCIEDELVARWVIESWMKEKNWIAYPIFDEKKELIWAKIINSYWEFTITKEDLDLIEERKKIKTDEEDRDKLENIEFI